MADLNQFLNQDLTAGDVTHSSGIGSVAGGGGAGGLSIDRRRELMNKPRVVGVYRYSRLGRQGSAVKPRAANQKVDRAYDASSDSFSSGATYSNRQRGGIKDRDQVDNGSIDRRQHFIEPPTRKYDRYG